MRGGVREFVLEPRTWVRVPDEERRARWFGGPHGRELTLLTDLGLSPLEAITAATANAPLTLGPQAPRSGRLEAGYDADVICTSGNPVTDITILADPAQITGVWKAGRRVVR